MANGSGYKIWADEVVDAEEFQGYMQRQVVASFDDATARDTAITAVPEGMLTADREQDIISVGEVGDVWTEFGRWGAWGSYSPTLDAATTPPTIGSSPVQKGRYFRLGTLGVVHAEITFGTGSASGTGVYEIGLPSACPAASGLYTGEEQVIGHGVCIISGTPYAVEARVISASECRLYVDATAGDLDANTPAVFGDGDTVFNGTFMYELTPGAP